MSEIEDGGLAFLPIVFLALTVLVGCEEKEDPFKKEVRHELDHIKRISVPDGQTVCERIAISGEEEVYLKICKDSKEKQNDR